MINRDNILVDRLFEAIGGAAGCSALAEAFYNRVAKDPILKPLFPGKSFRCAIEAFAAFLVQFFEGPAEHTQHRFFLSLRESHARFKLNPLHRAAWMRNMTIAIRESGMSREAQEALLALFEKSSRYITGLPEEVKLPETVEQRWTAQEQLDELVAAIQRRDTDRALSLARKLTYRPVRAQILALMVASNHVEMSGFVRNELTNDRTLGNERFNGRTLLHAAAGAGNLEIVELLLELGGDPNGKDDGGHTPLYSVANGRLSGGSGVVEALVRAGSEVNARQGVTLCTPLHMAARRGNVEITQTLLKLGADPLIKDRRGATAIARAKSCRQKEVLSVLSAFA